MKNKKPLYKQIIDYYCIRISSGELKPGDKLPSIRQAKLIHNTSVVPIMTAYKEMEEAGIIEILMGKGHYISKNAVTAIVSVIRVEIEMDIKNLLKKTSDLGFTRNDVIDLINKHWIECKL